MRNLLPSDFNEINIYDQRDLLDMALQVAKTRLSELLYTGKPCVEIFYLRRKVEELKAKKHMNSLRIICSENDVFGFGG